MSEAGEQEHHVKVFREGAWPYQWLGVCLCRRGIRCNSERDAIDFLVREGCCPPLCAGTEGRS